MSDADDTFARLLEHLANLTDPHRVLVNQEACSLYAQDIFTKALPAKAVVQPANIDELSSVVKAVTASGYEVIARGAGTSYSESFVPRSANAVIVDMRFMNRVLEVNTDDMYVTVECGCTWSELHEALKHSGYRTPYWGTLSGRTASIGGGLSQNSIFWGSGIYGTAADNVIGMQVVLADGSVLTTGSNAQLNSRPFFRHFGPDLTGLFTGDSGALGFKATASFRLIKQFEGRQYCAFSFESAEAAINTMSEVSRRGLATECFGFDPFLQSQRLKRDSVGKDIKTLTSVMTSAGSIAGALKDGASVALAGRRYMDGVDYSVQMIIEDYHQLSADAKAKEIVAIAERHKGQEIANSIPKITRANPFGPLNNVLGPNGERWVPLHGLVPHSQAKSTHQAILDIFKARSEDLEKYSIEVGFLFTTVASNCFVIEPVFFWPDATTQIHEEIVESAHFEKLNRYPEDLSARQCVASIREELACMFRDQGAVHFQIGKTFHYANAIAKESLELVNAIKKATDPHGLVNPGALGLS